MDIGLLIAAACYGPGKVLLQGACSLACDSCSCNKHSV